MVYYSIVHEGIDSEKRPANTPELVLDFGCSALKYNESEQHATMEEVEPTSETWLLIGGDIAHAIVHSQGSFLCGSNVLSCTNYPQIKLKLQHSQLPYCHEASVTGVYGTAGAEKLGTPQLLDSPAYEASKHHLTVSILGLYGNSLPAGATIYI